MDGDREGREGREEVESENPFSATKTHQMGNVINLEDFGFAAYRDGKKGCKFC